MDQIEKINKEIARNDSVSTILENCCLVTIVISAVIFLVVAKSIWAYLATFLLLGSAIAYVLSVNFSARKDQLIEKNDVLRWIQARREGNLDTLPPSDSLILQVANELVKMANEPQGEQAEKGEA